MRGAGTVARIDRIEVRKRASYLKMMRIGNMTQVLATDDQHAYLSNMPSKLK